MSSDPDSQSDGCATKEGAQSNSFFRSGLALRPLLTLLVGGGISEGLYIYLSRFQATNGRPVWTFLIVSASLFGAYVIGAVAAARDQGQGRRLLFLVISFGLLFRITLLPAGLRNDVDLIDGLGQDLRGQYASYETFLLYDQDVWRYLWEGHVLRHGLNPYRLEPASELLDDLPELDSSREEVWSEIRDRVGYSSIPVLYPPLAQFLFALSNLSFPGSVLGWKLWTVVIEVMACLFVALAARKLGQAVAPVLLLFLWNPLMVKEFAGSAHFDALVVLSLSLLAYAVVSGWKLRAYAALALATLSKLVPALLLLLLSPLWWGFALFAGLVGAGFLPFYEALPELARTGGVFAEHWRFNTGFYRILDWAFGEASIVAYLLLLAVLGITLRSRARDVRGFLEGSLWLLGMAIVLGPVVHAWYVTWLVPLACLTRSRTWIAFSAVVYLSFLVMLDGVERPWVVAVEHLTLMLIAAWDLLTRKERHHVNHTQTVPSHA